MKISTRGPDPGWKIVQAPEEKDEAEFGPVGLARLRARLRFSPRNPPTAYQAQGRLSAYSNVALKLDLGRWRALSRRRRKEAHSAWALKSRMRVFSCSPFGNLRVMRAARLAACARIPQGILYFARVVPLSVCRAAMNLRRAQAGDRVSRHPCVHCVFWSNHWPRSLAHWRQEDTVTYNLVS